MNDVHSGHGRSACGPYMKLYEQQRVAPIAEELDSRTGRTSILAARALLGQVVARNRSSEGQRPPLCGHLLGVPSQLDLGAQQLLASGAVLL